MKIFHCISNMNICAQKFIMPQVVNLEFLMQPLTVDLYQGVCYVVGITNRIKD